jgi:hypothetical protein
VLVTGVQTCALPISPRFTLPLDPGRIAIADVGSAESKISLVNIIISSVSVVDPELLIRTIILPLI